MHTKPSPTCTGLRDAKPLRFTVGAACRLASLAHTYTSHQQSDHRNPNESISDPGHGCIAHDDFHLQ